MSRLLDVESLYAGYGPLRILHGLDFYVDQGEVVVVLGANGAGKTTTLRALSGLIRCTGHIRLNGIAIETAKVHKRALLGLGQVPEGRGTLPDLTVSDNLRVGGFGRRRSEVAADIEKWFRFFPPLAERTSQSAGNLSGGEQQMLAIARAMMSSPQLLLLDEPSMGLSPRLTSELFGELARLNTEMGVSMLIVEQNARRALELATRAYALQNGKIVLEGSAADLANDDAIRRAYLGV